MKFKTSFFTACLVLYKSTAHPPLPVREYSGSIIKVGVAKEPAF